MKATVLRESLMAYESVSQLKKSRLLKPQDPFLITHLATSAASLQLYALALCALAFWFSQLSAHMLLIQ